jgi:hypothetical protein
MTAPAELEQAKTRVAETVDRLADELERISHQIHANPELCFEEHKAAGWLADFLDRQGAAVERGVGGLPTGRATSGAEPRAHHRDHGRVRRAAKHRARLRAQRDRDRGHRRGGGNRGGAADPALPGPHPGDRHARRGGRGRQGTDDGGGRLPGGGRGQGDSQTRRHRSRPSLGIIKVKCEFFGRASHASSWPWRGVNALNAMIQLFVSLDAMRQQLRPDARVHGIITKGGDQANIIPEHTASEFYLRAPTKDYCRELPVGLEGGAPPGAREGPPGRDHPRPHNWDGGALRQEPRADRLPVGSRRCRGGLRIDRLRQREPGDPDDPSLHPHLAGRDPRAFARVRGVGQVPDRAHRHGGGGQGPRNARARPGSAAGRARECAGEAQRA